MKSGCFIVSLKACSVFLLYFTTLLFPLAVAATEVECIREGCQSEALRRLSGSVQDKQCFTVVFRGARKSLDLVCPSEAEAQCWVRGLRTLKEYVANMTQKEKLNQYPDQNSQAGKYSRAEAAFPAFPVSVCRLTPEA